MNYTEEMYQEDMGLVMRLKPRTLKEAPRSDRWFNNVVIVGCSFGVFALILSNILWQVFTQ